ncbi:MAG TPA: flagellar biosynthesis anti-sigma factor FlgM [Methylobacter sp.]|jgi:negative regulator of flagellin synthesis FlgM
MAIEISGIVNSPTPIKTASKTGVDNEKKIDSINTENDDKVALTTTVQEIKKAFGSSSASPVNTDRVNAVRKAIADGNYSINAEKIAKKLIQFEKLMPPENNS